MGKRRLSGPVELYGNRVVSLGKLRRYLRIREDNPEGSRRDILNNLVISSHRISRGTGWNDHEIKLLTSEFQGRKEPKG